MGGAKEDSVSNFLGDVYSGLRVISGSASLAHSESCLPIPYARKLEVIHSSHTLHSDLGSVVYAMHYLFSFCFGLRMGMICLAFGLINCFIIFGASESIMFMRHFLPFVYLIYFFKYVCSSFLWFPLNMHVTRSTQLFGCDLLL